MKNKLQKIPETIWVKLQKIQQIKEGWNMMTIINECLDLGANYLIKKLTKKDAAKSQEATSNTILTPEDISELKEIAEYQKQRNIEIAKTRWTEDE